MNEKDKAENRVLLGKLTRTQGLKGGIRLLPVFSQVERFADLDLENCVFYWAPPATNGRAPGRFNAHQLKVEGFWFHQQYIILEFAGLSDIDAVAPLAGGSISIDGDMMWAPDEDEYLEYELVRMKVLDDESGAELGTVLSLEDGSAHNYLKVKPAEAGRKAFLVPFVKVFVMGVDREKREIRVRLPEGLTDL